MAFALKHEDVNNNAKSGTTTFTVPTQALAVGDVSVVVVAADNAGAAGVATTCTLSDGTANSYVLQRTTTCNPGINAGAVLYEFTCDHTAAVSLGGNITATFGVAMGAAAMSRTTFTRGAGTTVSVTFGDTDNAGGGVPFPLGTATLPAIGCIVFGSAAFEGTTAYTGDSDVLEGSWVAISGNGTTGGSGVTNMRITRQYKITSGTSTQTWNIGTASGDFAAALMVLQEVGSTPRHQAYTLHRRTALHQAVR